MSNDLASRLADARARKQERQQASEQKAEALELACLELEDKLIADGLGDPGVDFVVMATSEGPLALKRGTMAAYKAFMNGKRNANGDPSLADVEAFVRAAVVVPDAPTFNAWTEKRAGLPTICAAALADLYVGSAENTSKKS
jgi:putative sterol carrier protein